MNKPDPSFKNNVQEPLLVKDNIGKSIKTVDHAFQTGQEFIDTYRQLILANEKVISGVAFSFGVLLSWLLSSCTESITVMTSHKILIGIVFTLVSLLLISTKTMPLAYIATIFVSFIVGLGVGEVAIAWDSNTYMVVTVGACENPISMNVFLGYVVGVISGGLYIGKRYKLF